MTPPAIHPDGRTGIEITLARRPDGEPRPEDFRAVRVAVADPADREVLVRNVALSVDPYMRGRMRDAKSYAAPYALGEVMTGGAVGEVVVSRDDRYGPGDLVLSDLGWREWALGSGDLFAPLDRSAAPDPAAFLGILGMPGLTAYVGLLDIAGMRPGDVVFVSGAAGAVGSAAGQIARLRGAGRVIGSAGGARKCRWLTEKAGFDAALDYRAAPIAEQLTEAAPDGIDVYFDNVGGDHLEAALGALRPHGRVAACGSISGYNAIEPPPGPRTIGRVVGNRLTIRGFLVSDHADRRDEFVREVGGWLRGGSLVAEQTVVEGIEAMPEAFIGLLRGDNLGKMVVRP